jgi:hypothetical protein
MSFFRFQYIILKVGSKVHRHDANLCGSNVEGIWNFLCSEYYFIFCGNMRGFKFGVFQLLSVLAVGFGQGLYALDAADGSSDPPSTVNNRISTILAFFKTKICFFDLRLSMFSFNLCFSKTLLNVFRYQFLISFVRNPDYGKYSSRFGSRSSVLSASHLFEVLLVSYCFTCEYLCLS